MPNGKTITVKGIGRACAKVDEVVLSFSMETSKHSYEEAMEAAAKDLALLNHALQAVGFEADAVKTNDFTVRTDYQNIRDKSGALRQVFNGYIVRHKLKLEFDFDMARLAQTLSAVAACRAHPQLNIDFTVKDATAINEEMLRSAAANARQKAEILCAASGVSLGALRAIDYNWGEMELHSSTRYDMDEKCLAAPAAALPLDITPDDIDVSDTVTFVWEIQ
jgi:hypothetical protein